MRLQVTLLSVRGSGLWLLLAVSTCAGPARAADASPSKTQCASAYVAAQRLRKAGKLLKAKEKLEFCSDEACPSALTRDCKVWLRDVVANQPSVKLSVLGLDGKASDALRVQVDGRRLKRLPTAPLQLDPGRHTFHFEIDGEPPIEKNIRLSRGDKALPVAVDFSAWRKTLSYLGVQ